MKRHAVTIFPGWRFAQQQIHDPSPDQERILHAEQVVPDAQYNIRASDLKSRQLLLLSPESGLCRRPTPNVYQSFTTMKTPSLQGEWIGFRDCHIGPDLVLIYCEIEPQMLELTRLGSHSEL